LVLHPKIFCGWVYSSLATSTLLPHKMLNLSPPACLVCLEEVLVVPGKEKRVGNGEPGGEAGRGEAGVQGGTCVTGDGAYI